MPETQPRILLLDIETKPALAYTFGIRDQHITYKQLMPGQHGGTICVGVGWHGEKTVKVYSDWDHGHREMLERVHALLDEADAVCTYNGARFDLPKLNGEFMLAGMPPPAPPTQIDVFKTVRKMGLISSKLDYIAPALGLGGKVKHEGLEMWIAVMNGDPKAQRKMARYCAGDVRLLGQVYERIKPYILDHPHLKDRRADFCAQCGSNNLENRGWRRTKAFRIARVQCRSCGGWSTGRREAA